MRTPGVPSATQRHTHTCAVHHRDPCPGLPALLPRLLGQVLEMHARPGGQAQHSSAAPLVLQAGAPAQPTACRSPVAVARSPAACAACLHACPPAALAQPAAGRARPPAAAAA
eukprot:scaffold100977_cov16-Tisochrysis_lutea.AAC.1